jgi:hypothetical protein
MKDWKGNTKSTFKTIGASNHADHEREKRDYYATEPKAAEMLLELEQFAPHILEPCCGAGHLANVFRQAGYKVECNDIIDRGCNDTTSDYLTRTEEWQGDIITNPPYSKAQEFVEKSLSLVSDGSKVAMFLKLMFLEGKKRRTLFEEYPPRRIWVSSSRLKCAINGDFDNTGTSATAYAWYVWVKGYKGSPEVRWFN